MIEFDVDMSYLLECDELDKVVLNDENGEHEPMEFVPKDATVGNRSCASCPEMDNPDSYISHLQSALKWHDEHVPRPTNPRNTCAVLQGENQPEEVLFVGPDGVTHYQPENVTVGVGTCHNVGDKRDFCCSECGVRMFIESDDTYTMIASDERTIIKRPNFCPNCGKRVDR